MKKLLAAITALAVFGVTNQTFAHSGNDGEHAADAVWVAVQMDVLEDNPNGFGKRVVPGPTDYYTDLQGANLGHGFYVSIPGHTYAKPGGAEEMPWEHFLFLANRGTNGNLINERSQYDYYPFSVNMDGTVTPAEGIWNFTANHLGASPWPGEAVEVTLRVRLRGVGTPYNKQDNTDAVGERNDGGGPAGPAGADGAAGPAGPAGPAGTDGAAGATGGQGPQGDAGADGTAGAAGDAGATGADAPCRACADVATAAVAMACIVLDANPATDIQELRDTAATVVDTMLISANICEVGCDVAAEINTAIDTKLNP